MRDKTRHALRLAAIARGDKTYDPGSPCKEGHLSKRYASNNGCLTCAGRPLPGMFAGVSSPLSLVLECPQLGDAGVYALLKVDLQMALDQWLVEHGFSPVPDSLRHPA